MEKILQEIGCNDIEGRYIETTLFLEAKGIKNCYLDDTKNAVREFKNDKNLIKLVMQGDIKNTLKLP